MMEKQRPLEYCFHCGGPTGKAGQGDGSLYCECDEGPFCEDCWGEHHQGNVLAFKLATVEIQRTELLEALELVLRCDEKSFIALKPSWRKRVKQAIATGKE